ncbi:MAG TPA: AAA family ATPase [Thermoflexia bacterium]|nr:AAA family ATPase [Thermoflexia bacterium]
MLKRIYVDNYKSLVNVEVPIQEINLFLGENGSGKSALFEVLKGLQDFVCNGKRIKEAFPTERLTRWQNSQSQTFELEITGNEGQYKYQLVVEHNPDIDKARVKHEQLLFDGNPLIELETNEVHLFRDDFSAGPTYPADGTLSAVGAIPPRKDNTRLTWFREYLKRFVIVQINPSMMHSESPRETSAPTIHFENYISWYRYISQDQGMTMQLIAALQAVLPGFEHFKFEAVGEKHRLLKVYFQSEDDAPAVAYAFDELSDGQRMLIALYSLLYAARAEQKYTYTLCIDEPGNFISLSEIQPWLTELYESCTEHQMQALLISHHPELINYLLASPVGYWFERESNRPTRVRRITAQSEGGLPSAELVARGWLNA